MLEQSFAKGHNLRTVFHAFENAVLYGGHPLALPLQRVVQKLLHGPREITFTFTEGALKGLKFSCLTSHRYFFLREDYEQEIGKHMRAFVKPGAICYEVGAHYGFWALTMARLCEPSGKVFAFEPNNENRAMLMRNLAQNEIENVEVIPMALSDSTEPVRMSGGGTTCSIRQSAEDSAPIVQCTTADIFCREHPVPDFMLIDVEGSAGAVLRGAAEILEQRHFPLICEIHDKDEQAEFRSLMQGRRGKIRALDKFSSFPHRTLAV